MPNFQTVSLKLEIVLSKEKNKMERIFYGCNLLCLFFLISIAGCCSRGKEIQSNTSRQSGGVKEKLASPTKVELVVSVDNTYRWIESDLETGKQLLGLVLDSPKIEKELYSYSPGPMIIPREWRIRYTMGPNLYLKLDIEGDALESWFHGDVITSEYRDTSKHQKKIAELLERIKRKIRKQ